MSVNMNKTHRHRQTNGCPASGSAANVPDIEQSQMDSNAHHFFNSYDGTIAPSSALPLPSEMMSYAPDELPSEMMSYAPDMLNSEDAQHYINSYDGSTI